MSAEDEPGIDFSISHDPESFRLLELPPPLLALIKSEKPPILYLKSEPATSVLPGAPAANAVVCTHDQTFEVRQVQSSNVLYILQPSQKVIHRDFGGYADSPGVTAVGECKALLELVAIPTTPVSFLRPRLPLYVYKRHHPEGHHETPNEIEKSRSDLLEDAPFSESEFESAWNELCAFEAKMQAWRPSAVMLQDLWASFMTAVTTRGIDATKPFQVDEVAEMVEKDGLPSVVLRAMLRRVCSEPSKRLMESTLTEATLHADKCVPWVGAVLLEERTILQNAILTSNFLAKWQDQLPERWRTHVSLDLIQGLYTDFGHGEIRYKDTSIPAPIQSHSPAATTSSKGASKWHEKFKSVR